LGSIGKIFKKIESSLHIDNIDVYEENDIVIVFYDYKKISSYIDVLNNAYSNGLFQLIFTPNKFINVIKDLSDLNFNVKKIEFDPPLESEEQELINKILFENVRLKNFSRITKEITILNDEQDFIPKKLSFMSQSGNYYSLFNNGIVSIEDDEYISELSPFLSRLNGGLR
jgi:hypothetical protein